MLCTTKTICKASKVHSGQYFDLQHKSFPKPGPELLWCTKCKAWWPNGLCVSSQVIVIFSNRQHMYYPYSTTLFCPHVEINIRKFVTVGSPCAAKFHAISFMWLVCFANMVVKFLSKVSSFISPFHGPEAGQGTWVYFPMSGSLINFCILLYLELYFHVVNLHVASFDKHSLQVISVNFAFILVSQLPFVVS